MFKLFKTQEATAVTTTATATATLPEGMTLEQVRTAMLQLMMGEASHHHRLGQYYNYVVDHRLAEKAGYKDAKDYFSKQLADLSQSALSMYGAVAKAFSEPVARRYGVTCLYLLLTYKEATHIEVNHTDPEGTLIEVPDDKGQVVSRPFGQCTVEQLRRALLHRRKPGSTKPLPPEAELRAGQYREAVTGRFPKGVRVKVLVRNEKGKAVLDFKGIPLEQVSQLVAALSEELPPARTVQLVEPPAVG
jgi:hypothetical protein